MTDFPRNQEVPLAVSRKHQSFELLLGGVTAQYAADGSIQIDGREVRFSDGSGSKEFLKTFINVVSLVYSRFLDY